MVTVTKTYWVPGQLDWQKTSVQIVVSIQKSLEIKEEPDHAGPWGHIGDTKNNPKALESSDEYEVDEQCI